MRKHITFNTMASRHDKNDGNCTIMHNMMAGEGTANPTEIYCEETGSLREGLTLVATHQGEGYCHLIVEQQNGDGTYDYLWSEDDAEVTTPLLSHAPHFNDFTSLGDTLCMTGDDTIVIALWLQSDNHYCIIRREGLLYDIHVGQDMQERVTVSTPITPTVGKWLQAQGQEAEKLQEVMEHAIDQARANRGGGCFKHVCLAIAALRLADDTHIMFSNIFALIPADMTTTIEADHERGVLSATTYLHRHTISIDMRDRECLDSAMIAGVDIFLSEPINFIDTNNVEVLTDQEGRTTALTFRHQNRRDTMQSIEKASFHLAMTITRQQLGETLAIQDIATDSTPIDLDDFRRTAMGAKWAYCHNHRLSVGDIAQVLFSPFEIGVRYRFASLSREERQQLTPEQQQVALQGEWMAGSRADINDNNDGQTVNIVVRAVTDDDNTREMWWKGQTQYPMPGMMMFPDGHVRELEYHIRMDNSNGSRFFKTTQPLEKCHNKGMAVAIHTPRNLTHRVTRPAFLSLLLQQQRVLTYDDTNGEYCTSYELWDEESEEDFLSNYEKAQTSWVMTRQHSLLCTSCQDNPLVFPLQSRVLVGDGRLLYLQANTRRTADGLFGDGQYHAFTDQGIYVLRLYGGKWQARQAVTRINMVERCRPVATNDAVAFVASRGVMIVRGSTCSCISDELTARPTTLQALPRIEEIINTEPDIGIDTTCDFSFHPEHALQMVFDNTNDQLWLLCNKGETQSWWTYSLKEKTWATATSNISHVVGGANNLWATSEKDGNTCVGRLIFGANGRRPVFILTQPLSLGAAHVRKTVHRVIIRGLFTDSGRTGSHLGMALYGSNDLTHWHLTGTSDNIYHQQRRGTPYAWLRLAVIGRLLPSENIEGASIEYHARHDLHIR